MTQKSKTQKAKVLIVGKVKSLVDGKVSTLPKDSELEVELIDGKLPPSLINKVAFKK